VWVLKKSGHVLAGTSCYANRSVSWPELAEAEQVSFLTRLAMEAGLKRWVLFPTDDEAVGLVGRNHECLSAHFHLTTQPWALLSQVCDKRKLHQLAEKIGIAYPWTFLATSRKDLAALKCAFPVIVKPAIRENVNQLTIDKAWRADNPDALLALYDKATVCNSADHVMIQELIPGGGEEQFSFAAVCCDGRAVNWLAARRARQYPMDFGRFSTYVETIDEPQVVEPAIRLLKEIGLSGLVEVEFKRDPRDGRFKILDVNPRVWGWQTLGAKAGVDFAWAAFQVAMGKPVPEARGRPGVRWFRMTADLPIVVSEMFHRRLSLREYLKSLREPIQFSVFARDDPLPGLLEIPLQGYRFLQRLITGVLGRFFAAWKQCHSGCAGVAPRAIGNDIRAPENDAPNPVPATNPREN
jgi:predicted ATP-grasp superfamily ATP-dependent carboligase